MTKSTFTIENQAKMCSNCSDKLIKYGKTKNGKQRYKCKFCHHTKVEFYSYKAYLSTVNSNIIQLTKEGLGIRSPARYLKISTTTLLKRLLEISSKKLLSNHLSLRTHLKRLNRKTICIQKHGHTICHFNHLFLELNDKI